LAVKLHALLFDRRPKWPDHGGPEVFVVDLNTNRDTKFHAEWSDTLQKLWDTAYDKLKEGRRDRDQFECNSGRSLMGQLSLTLEQFRDQHLCEGFKFQIKGDTGGA
jgi:hypothetical protein